MISLPFFTTNQIMNTMIGSSEIPLKQVSSFNLEPAPPWYRCFPSHVIYVKQLTTYDLCQTNHAIAVCAETFQTL